MMKFFTRQHEKLQPRRLKSAAEMEEAWQRILERRRLAEPDDSCGIDDRDMLSNMWIAWQMDWLARELTQEQRRLRWASKTKMFSTWCESHIGRKNFIMVVWQIGLTWAPSPDLFNANFISVVEHIAKLLCSWTSRLARAAPSHKSEDLTDECRSGRKRSLNQRGLTPRAVQNAPPGISPDARA